MLESRSRLETGEKKTEAVTVKMPESTLHFCEVRAKQRRMESAPEYIRHLIDLDRAQAEHDRSLLEEALGEKVSVGTVESITGGQS